MKKIIFSVIAVLSLLVPALVFTHSATATTCPVKMPETLLALYRNSDTIYVGRFTGMEKGKVISDEENYTEVEIKKHFDVSTILKGKPEKTLTLVDTDYQYKNNKAGFETIEEVQAAQVVEETSLEDYEDTDYESLSVELRPGDDVLLFLHNDEDSGRLEFTDYRDGLKDIPLADIAVYEARIKELNSIFAAEKPDPEKITDWLVRCAEDQATRWEGTYELERSFDALEYKTQREAERKAKAANGETVEGEDTYFNEGLDTGRTTIFASLLNEYQKQTLANLLLNSEFQAAPKRPGQTGFIRGDSELMSLVSRWADTRIAALFLSRLRGGTYTPRENSDLMERIASILGDEQVAAIAEKYSNAYYERDDAQVAESELDDAEEITADDETADENAAVDTEPAQAVDPISTTADQPAEETAGAETEKKPVVTYKEFRDLLVAKFLRRADEVIANPEARTK